MTNQHTPGPWFLANGNEIHNIQTKWDASGARISETPNIIATVEYYPTRTAQTDYSITEANARLIAAAPEMLEALKMLRKTPRLAHPSDLYKVDDLVDKVIAKATGGTANG